MKIKNLIVKRKVHRKILNKDPKINKFYNSFKKKVFKNINRKDFAIAVSGGSDSLSLAYLSKLYSLEFKNKFHVLIVNHRLRKESYKEAEKVKKILKNKNMQSKILNWKGKIPKSNIQKHARNIRYSLIANFCSKEKIRYVVTAHHMDDQIENFFIRLFRGSGVTGLSSMSEISDYNKKLKIVRPLLGFKKTDLKYITLKYFKTYIKDPSNKDEKFLRVKVRKHRNQLEKEGLDTGKIIKTINNLISANKALSYYKSKSLDKHVSFLSKDKCVINKKIFTDEAGEIIFKSFSDIFSLVSGTYYPPRSKKVVNLIKRLRKTNFEKSTLGGCFIEKKDNFILISKEPKIRKISYELGK